MPKPIKIGSPRFLKLQQKWYKKLAKKGHVDVERYQDFNKMPVSTMPRLHGSFIYDPEADEISDEAEFVAMADTDKAGFWREVGREASAMDPADKMYNLANAFAEHGTFTDAATECGIDAGKATRALRRWLRSVDLKAATGLSRTAHDPPQEPGPVRKLSKAEIAKLDYTPPRRK